MKGCGPREVAQAQGVSVRTVYKWVRRFREAGHFGLQDRTSRPARSPFATDAATVGQIIERRQQRQTYRQVAQALGIGESTVARILKRRGLNRLAALSPARPDNRYEHDAHGDLLHLDIKKPGHFKRPGHRMTGDRQQNTPGAGSEYVHVAIDDHTEWPSAAFTRTKQAGAPAWPCYRPCANTPAWASISPGCSPTTAPDIAPGASSACAGGLG